MTALILSILILVNSTATGVALEEASVSDSTLSENTFIEENGDPDEELQLSGNTITEEEEDASNQDLQLGESPDSIVNGDSSYGLSLSENECFESTEQVSGNNVVEDHDSSLDGEENGENITVSDNNLLEDEEQADGFPGAKEKVLSEEEKEDKNIVREYLPQILSMEEGVDYVPDEIIVSAKDEEEAELYASAFGGEVKSYIDGEEDFAVILLENNDGKEMWGNSEVREGEQKAVEESAVFDAVIASADEDTNLPAAWPNYYYHLLETEYTDPYLDMSNSRYQWYHNVIGSHRAWEYGYTGKEIKVAVLDTGIKSGHEDVSATAYVVDENIGYEDNNGHGTHVAGIIGAMGKNQRGGVGVAPDAQLLSIKVIEGKTGGTSTIMMGVQEAIDQEADIINLSLGGVAYSQPFEKKIKEAYEQGIAVFCAAGNDGTNAFYYPGAYEGAVSVAALDKNNQKAGFSNYSTKVRYSAPGVGIYSTYSSSTSSYGSLNGTSQAAPIVSGTAAILLSSGKVGGEGKKRVDNLLSLMDKSCVKVTGSGLGKGYVDLIKALGLDSVTAAPSAPTASQKGGTYKEAKLEVTLASSPGTTTYYTLDGKNINLTNGKISDGAIPYTPGEVITLEGKTTINLKARSVSNINGLLGKQLSVTYTLRPVASSVKITSATGDTAVAKGKSLQLKAEFFPAYTADKGVKWFIEGSPKGVTVSSGKVNVTKQAEAGEYTVNVITKDINGEYAGVSDSFTINVVDEENPVTAFKPSVKSVTVNAQETSEITIAILKKDGTAGTNDEITWWTEQPKIAVVHPQGNNELVITGIGKGKTKLVGVAKDGHGKRFTMDITVKQPVNEITIQGHSTLAAGKSITLKATALPAEANNKALVWSVLPIEGEVFPQVTVNGSGKVTASSKTEAGICLIRVKAKDGSEVFAQHQVTVTVGRMKTLNLDKTKTSVFRKKNYRDSPIEDEIQVITTGDNTGLWEVTSNKPDLVVVEKKENSFIVRATGKATGTASITVSSTDGSNLKKTCQVTVRNPVTGLWIAPQSGRGQYLAKGKKLKLVSAIETGLGTVDGQGKKLKWTSSNPEAVKVDQNGNVTGLTESSSYATITAETTDGSNVSATYMIQTRSETLIIELKNYSTLYNELELGSAYGFEFIFGNKKSDFFNPSKDTVVEVNKAGLEPYYVSASSGKKLGLMANKPGTYRITISLKDGSTVKKTYIFKVI